MARRITHQISVFGREVVSERLGAASVVMLFVERVIARCLASWERTEGVTKSLDHRGAQRRTEEP
jgi:hypothetical protein